ncbi:MAG: transposase [Bacteroidales bacterium]|nr:transposase [Bacteroidales bacterium]
MTREKRQWSKEQKLQIIQEVEVNGLQPTLRKYNLSQSLFPKWKRKFNENGIMGLESRYSRIDPEKRKMEQEIKRLRELVGELSLELRFKDELLKKSRY